MKYLFTLILFTNLLLSATLLNQNIYDRENRVDLMLSFDTPYDGKIRQAKDERTVNIFLSNVQLQQPFSKQLQNSLVSSITITRADSESIMIKITSASKKLKVEASRTLDRFGLRLRIVPSEISSQKTSIKPSYEYTNQSSQSQPINLKNDSDTLPGWRYWTVIGIMLFLLVVLFLIKKRGIGNSSIKGAGWLMPKNQQISPIPEAIIRYQKPIDRQNRIVLLEFNERQYLMLLGNSNILLDSFSQASIIEDEDSFNQLFEANKKQLNNFLKENHPDAYEAFKENATKEERL
ncbi:hypothetical protein RZR97_04870 [Hydrogenimonas thermophila]|uniref:hypothetical protein n=1 Tax=Hydrogenimonas thermophila TaxID=223786 RepID=UPI00293701B1|nr:hypothetical protein [Hydrogenimonas thermophila]WOE70907.1 hypothetical protein RZR91_04890 [Hydrogenimonas thermophila]WOE73425.1 hypothetical protein RZR97_04870 [Hydrogenimonas thermophila]